MWNDLISGSDSHVRFSEHCEVQFSSKLLVLDLVVENMDISRIWKYTRQNIDILDKGVVCYLSYNSIIIIIIIYLSFNKSKRWIQNLS
jgi:hypothetical protein